LIWSLHDTSTQLKQLSMGTTTTFTLRHCHKKSKGDALFEASLMWHPLLPVGTEDFERFDELLGTLAAGLQYAFLPQRCEVLLYVCGDVVHEVCTQRYIDPDHDTSNALLCDVWTFDAVV
jgi:hypothetical protein